MTYHLHVYILFVILLYVDTPLNLSEQFFCFNNYHHTTQMQCPKVKEHKRESHNSALPRPAAILCLHILFVI